MMNAQVIVLDGTRLPVVRANPWAVPATVQVVCAKPGNDVGLFGTDFSGMDMVALQLRRLQGLTVKFRQLFASEPWSVARTFLQVNHGITPAADVRRRSIPSVRVHLYAAGPPCQPWAPGGKRQGLADDKGRAALYFESLRFVHVNRPYVFFLENSHLLYTYDQGRFVKAVKWMCRQWGYRVWCSPVHTHRWGLPHHRSRTYIVGLHTDCSSLAFRWPTAIPQLMASDLLGARRPGESASGRPPGRTPSRAVDIALERWTHRRERSDDVDAFVNIHHGAKWTEKGSRPTLHLPSLTFALRSAPKPWLLTRGRPITTAEAARFQGVVPEEVRWPADGGHTFGLLGNTMSANVVERLLTRMLPCICLDWTTHDTWESNKAQASLKQSARRAGPPPGATAAPPVSQGAGWSTPRECHADSVLPPDPSAAARRLAKRGGPVEPSYASEADVPSLEALVELASREAASSAASSAGPARPSRVALCLASAHARQVLGEPVLPTAMPLLPPARLPGGPALRPTVGGRFDGRPPAPAPPSAPAALSPGGPAPGASQGAPAHSGPGAGLVARPQAKRRVQKRA